MEICTTYLLLLEIFAKVMFGSGEMVKKLLVLGIKAYQCLSRAVLIRNCRFYPSCSQYAIEAIEKFGIIGGLKKATYRILRCSPATDGGYDPVR